MGRSWAATSIVALLVSRDAAADAARSSDPSLADLSLEELLAEEISPASYVLPAADEQPVSMTTITREEIEQSGARTVAEVLGLLVPGYFVVEDQDDVIAGFRGFAPDNNSKVLLLVDGRSVNTEWFWGPPDALLNGIDLAWIERIEVIRGPGSVTLGQGALLGVINVVTKRPTDGPYAHVGTTLGTSRLAGGRIAGGFVDGDVRGSFYLSRTDFAGQRLRDEGWARSQENPVGVSVFDRGHHLKAADQQLALVRLTVGEVTVQALQVEQVRDNYNFYRDREVIEQRLLALTAWWQHELRPDVDLELRAGYDHDEIGQRSLDGQAMAGTREDRVSGLGVVTASNVFARDRLAVGVEVEHVEMGLPDRHHQNLIVNDLADRATATNTSHTYVERSRSTAAALLAEYAYRTERVTAHAGLRFDLHQYWGAAVSPRVGALVHARRDLVLRAGLQTGFRGAVGVHYAGGFRHDGLLAERNFDAVDDNPALAALGFGDVRPTVPERMTSFELGGRYQCGDRTTIDAVAFLDRMTRVIDVGVIFVDDALAAAPPEQRRIGSDEIGDWNGWFFFKNNPGAITSGGLEVDARWHWKWLTLRGSVALAAILDLDRAADQIGSMYVSGTPDDPHFRAYPEQVVRLGARVQPCARCWVNASSVGFGRWYSPAGVAGAADGDPGAWLDLAAGYRLPAGFSVSATLKNLVSVGELWPMNSNAGDPSISAGTPAFEDRTAWVTLSYDH